MANVYPDLSVPPETEIPKVYEPTSKFPDVLFDALFAETVTVGLLEYAVSSVI